MTGLDPSRHVIVEIATLVTDDELQGGGRRPRPRRVGDRRAARTRWTTTSATCTPSSGLLERSRPPHLPGRRRRSHARFPPRHIPNKPVGSARRKLHRDGPPVPRGPAPRDRGVAPLPVGRRLDASRSCAAGGTPTSLAGAPRQGGRRTGRWTTSWRASPSWRTTARPSSSRRRSVGCARPAGPSDRGHPAGEDHAA